MRNPFRRSQRYATFEDERGVVWRETEVRVGDDWYLDPTIKPIKVNDPNYVATWESVDEHGLRPGESDYAPTITVHTGPYPTPKALDYLIYSSVGFVILMVGTLIGAAA